MAKKAKEKDPTGIMTAPEFQKMRRNKATGAVEKLKQGRPHPDYEYGYVDGAGAFHLGDIPSKRRKRGRKKGSKNKSFTVGNGRKPAGGLSESEAIVRREVDARLKTARDAAINAFNAALG